MSLTLELIPGEIRKPTANIIWRQHIHSAMLYTRISGAFRCGGIHIQVHRILSQRGWKRHHMEWSGHRHRLATGWNRWDNTIRQGQEVDELQGFKNQVLNLHTSWYGLLTENGKSEMNLTWQCLKVGSTKLIVEVKTSVNSNRNLNLIKSFHYFLGIVQNNAHIKSQN